MKFMVVLFAMVILVTKASVDDEELLNYYEAVLAKDDQKMSNLMNCLLDQAPCGDFEQMKGKIIKFIKDKCSDCNQKQKEKYDKIMKTVHEKYDKESKELMKKLANH